jgi:hypothetical protein
MSGREAAKHCSDAEVGPFDRPSELLEYGLGQSMPITDFAKLFQGSLTGDW